MLLFCGVACFGRARHPVYALTVARLVFVLLLTFDVFASFHRALCLRIVVPVALSGVSYGILRADTVGKST